MHERNWQTRGVPKCKSLELQIIIELSSLCSVVGIVIPYGCAAGFQVTLHHVYYWLMYSLWLQWSMIHPPATGNVLLVGCHGNVEWPQLGCYGYLMFHYYGNCFHVPVSSEMCPYCKKNHIRFENTPCLIPGFLLWQAHRQESQNSMKHPINHFWPRDLHLWPMTLT